MPRVEWLPGNARGETLLNANDFSIASAVASLTPALICYVDRNEHCVFINPAFERWLGLQSGEAVGKSIEQITGPDLDHSFKNHFAQVLQDSHARLRNRRRYYTAKKAELPLQTVLDTIPVFAAMLDMRGNITFMNRNAIQSIEKSKTDVIGKHLLECAWWSELLKERRITEQTTNVATPFL